VLRLDVTSIVDIEAAAEVVAAHTDGLDVLVNNAGTGQTTTGLSGVDGERMRAVLDLNTVAPVLVTRRFVPSLRWSRSGRGTCAPT
jgi:3-oxoacyl-[acyl-carrier protein] reductase